MIMHKLVFSFLFTLLFDGISYSQNLTPLWTTMYQGAGDNSDRFNKIIADGQGNFIAVGYTIKPNNYRDFLTVKFDANGDTLWWRTKNGSSNDNDEAISVCVDAHGNVFVVGYRTDDETQDDILVVKYDQSGFNLWDTTWNSVASLDDVPVDVKVDNAGDIYVAGIAEPDSFMGSNDFITLKYSTTGALLWQQQYSRQGVIGGKDEIRGIALGNNNNVCVTGRSESLFDDDMLTICYDNTTGAQIWIHVYNSGNGNDRSNCIVSDASGNFIVAGRNDNGHNDDFRIIKYNSGGLIQWIRFYNSPSNKDDEALCITTDQSENVYVSGISYATGNSQCDMATMLINSAGIIQWVGLLGSVFMQDDIPSAIVADDVGNVWITGKSDQDLGLSVNNDYLTAMYNSAGQLQWQQRHSGSQINGSDIASSLILDGSGNVLVAGGSEYVISQKDATVVKYDITGNTIWKKNMNGRGDNSETSKSIVVDAFDNSYLGGYAFRYERYRDATIVKIDPSGSIICSFEYNGSNSEDDEINEMVSDNQGNIIAAGFTKSLGQKSDFLLIKFNTVTCDTIWTRIYDFVGQSDRAVSVACDLTGNIYVTGRSDNNILDTVENSDILTIKYDSNGNPLWIQRYNGTGNMRDEATKILLDYSGYVIVSGRAENVHDDDFVVIKYDPQTGDPVWSSPVFYNGPFSNDDRPLDMVIDHSNNIFVCGYSQTGSVPAPDDAAVIKVNAAGNLVAAYGYDGIGGGHDRAVKISCDISGNVFVAFESDADPDPNIINFDIRTEKFDSNFAPLWNVAPVYSSPVYKDDLPAGITVDNDGNVYVIGNSENDTAGGITNRNWIILRYDAMGNQTMSGMIDGPNQTDDSPNAMVLKGTSLSVCGYQENTGNNLKDMAVQRFELPVSVDEFNSREFVSVFPNPFSDKAQISLDITPQGETEIIIYDCKGSIAGNIKINGRKIINLDRNNLNPGFYHFILTGNDGWQRHGRFIIQ